MGALARELRVAPSSLYNHFQSRDEVLGAVSDAVVSEIRVDSLREAVVVLAERELTVEAKTELWVSAFGAWGVSYRDAFSESAELVAALALTPVGWAPQTLRMYELVLEALAAFGCPQERALSVVEALEAFLWDPLWTRMRLITFLILLLLGAIIPVCRRRIGCCGVGLLPRRRMLLRWVWRRCCMGWLGR